MKYFFIQGFALKYTCIKKFDTSDFTNIKAFINTLCIGQGLCFKSLTFRFKNIVHSFQIDVTIFFVSAYFLCLSQSFLLHFSFMCWDVIHLWANSFCISFVIRLRITRPKDDLGFYALIDLDYLSWIRT